MNMMETLIEGTLAQVHQTLYIKNPWDQIKRKKNNSNNNNEIGIPIYIYFFSLLQYNNITNWVKLVDEESDKCNTHTHNNISIIFCVYDNKIYSRTTILCEECCWHWARATTAAAADGRPIKVRARSLLSLNYTQSTYTCLHTSHVIQ